MKIKRNFSALAVSAAIFCACVPQKQVVNREVEHSQDGKMLLGRQLLSKFSQAPYSEWYEAEKESYQIDQAAVTALKKAGISGYNITAVVGTWCEDSHREFPRLIKVLQAAGYPEERLTIIAVNRKKESPGGEDGLYNLQKVPTFIVTKYGKPVGRIIEFPQSGYIERDLLMMLEKYNQKSTNPFK